MPLVDKPPRCRPHVWIFWKEWSLGSKAPEVWLLAWQIQAPVKGVPLPIICRP
jgi:hypothetical protein